MPRKSLFGNDLSKPFLFSNNNNNTFEPCHLNRELAMHYPSNNNVTIELKFPPEYPVVPPFLRVVSPAIQAGHVILGGAIFLDVLLPKKCEILCSTQTYSPAIELLQLFFQLAQSMVEFMHDSILGLMDIDWNAVFDDFNVDRSSFPKLQLNPSCTN